MNNEFLENYYNKFCEDKRLLSRHGKVEFFVTTNYIEKYLPKLKDKAILDNGAGTGRYSIYLQEKGYEVTALELVKNNLGILKAKNKSIKAHLGNALDLSRFADESFEMILIFGPMYHLFDLKEKRKVLEESLRVLKKGGYIFISYLMNEYAVIRHGIMDNQMMKAIKENKIDGNFHINNSEEDLYDYVRIEDIDNINKGFPVKRLHLVSQDGPTDYIRKYINEMDEDTFNTYLKYVFSICERKELLGASSHVLDILQKSDSK